MTPKAPPEIFLQNTDSSEEHKQGESAWSEIRVNESDVRYIRADLFPSPTGTSEEELDIAVKILLAIKERKRMGGW